MSKAIDVLLVENLISEAESKIVQHAENKKTGAHFNIFKLLDRHKSEVKGHSALIAEFLNPIGMHGQGDLFLKLFFKTLNIEKQLSTCGHWRVLVEEGKDIEGRIDILLIGRYPDGQKVGIAIENKIHARLQQRQLGRYYDFLEMNFGAYKDSDKKLKWLLYYLTLKGSDPSSQSVEGIPKGLCSWTLSKTIEESSKLMPIMKISYQEHVMKWMTACHEHLVNYPGSREVVAQYIEAIGGLIGKEDSVPEKLKGLLNSPDKVMAAAQLSQAVDLVRSDIVQRLWGEIRQAWEAEAQACPLNDENGSQIVGKLMPNIHCKFDDNRLNKLSRKYFMKKSQRDKYFGLYSDAYTSKWGKVWLEVRFDVKFYVGLYGVDDKRIFPMDVVKGVYNISQPLYAVQDDDKVKDFDRIIIKSKDPLNFNGNGYGFFKLLDDDARKIFVQEIIEALKYLIKSMKLEIVSPDNHSR